VLLAKKTSKKPKTAGGPWPWAVGLAGAGRSQCARAGPEHEHHATAFISNLPYQSLFGGALPGATTGRELLTCYLPFRRRDGDGGGGAALWRPFSSKARGQAPGPPTEFWVGSTYMSTREGAQAECGTLCPVGIKRELGPGRAGSAFRWQIGPAFREQTGSAFRGKAGSASPRQRGLAFRGKAGSASPRQGGPASRRQRGPAFRGRAGPAFRGKEGPPSGCGLGPPSNDPNPWSAVIRALEQTARDSVPRAKAVVCMAERGP
jgi:hypothetical protein